MKANPDRAFGLFIDHQAPAPADSGVRRRTSLIPLAESSPAFDAPLPAAFAGHEREVHDAVNVARGVFRGEIRLFEGIFEPATTRGRGGDRRVGVRLPPRVVGSDGRDVGEGLLGVGQRAHPRANRR